MLKKLLVLKTECIKFSLHIKCLLLLYVWSADETTIYRLKKWSFCRFNIYLQIEELLSRQSKELSGDQGTMRRSKFNLKIKEVFHLQIKELWARQRITSRFKNCLQIEELSTYWWSIPSADSRIICRLNFNMQMEEFSAYQ